MQKHHDAMLPRYEAPVFPEGLKDLVAALEVNPVTRRTILMLNNRLKSLKGVPDARYTEYSFVPPKTSDGYTWRLMFSFRSAGSVVSLLLPQRDDLERRDGTLYDRSPAVYCVRKLPDKSIDALIAAITKRVAR